MNHVMSDVTKSHLNRAAQLFTINEKTGEVPDMLDNNMSSSSSTVVGAKNGDQS